MGTEVFMETIFNVFFFQWVNSYQSKNTTYYSILHLLWHLLSQTVTSWWSWHTWHDPRDGTLLRSWPSDCPTSSSGPSRGWSSTRAPTGGRRARSTSALRTSRWLSASGIKEIYLNCLKFDILRIKSFAFFAEKKVS